MDANEKSKSQGPYGAQIAQTALQGIGMSPARNFHCTMRGSPEFAAAVSILFTKATHQAIMLGTAPKDVLSTSILYNSLLHDSRFKQVPVSEAAPGDIVIEASKNNAAAYAGIVEDHGRIISMGPAGTVQNNHSLVEVQGKRKDMAIFRYIGVQKYRSDPLANAGYRDDELRLPAGQTGGGRWTAADGGATTLKSAYDGRRKSSNCGSKRKSSIPRMRGRLAPDGSITIEPLPDKDDKDDKDDNDPKTIRQAAEETGRAFLSGLARIAGGVRSILFPSEPDRESAKPEDIFQLAKEISEAPDNIDMTKPKGLGHAMAAGVAVAAGAAVADAAGGAGGAVESSESSVPEAEQGPQAVIDKLSSNLDDETLSNVQARDWYNSSIPTRANVIDKMRAAGYSDEEIAHEAFDLRNAARTKARDLMADREAAEDLEKTEPNLTWDQVMKKYKGDYKAIIQKSLESDEEVNKMIEEKRTESGIYETHK